MNLTIVANARRNEKERRVKDEAFGKRSLPSEGRCYVRPQSLSSAVLFSGSFDNTLQ